MVAEGRLGPRRRTRRGERVIDIEELVKFGLTEILDFEPWEKGKIEEGEA